MTKSREELKESLLEVIEEADKWIRITKKVLDTDDEDYLQSVSAKKLMRQLVKIEINNLKIKEFLFQEFGILCA